MGSSAGLSDFLRSVGAIAPVLIGISFFGVSLAVAEYVVVRRKMLDDYGLKLVDFIWVCTSAVALLFLLLSIRETALKDHIAEAEGRAARVRDELERLIPHVTSLCMAGRWPGVDARPIYTEAQLQEHEAAGHRAYMANGGLVTPDCMDPIFTSTLMAVSGSEQLWRQSPSVEAALAFEAYRRELFGSRLPAQRQEVMPQLTEKAIQNGRIAVAYFDGRFGEIVAGKDSSGRAAAEYKVIHAVVTFGKLWPFVLSLALAFRLAKAHLDLRNARRKPVVAAQPM